MAALTPVTLRWWLKILRKVRKASSRIKTLDFRRGGFRLLKESVGGIPLWTSLKSKGAKRLTDHQEQPPQKKLVCPIMLKVEHALQKASVKKIYILTELKWKKGTIQKAKAGVECPEGIQSHCSNMQWWS